MKNLIIILSLFLVTGFQSVSAEARHFVRYNREWNKGRWVHDRHEGRLGWWWVIGPSWYYYDRPHSFVVQPQTVIIQQTPVVVQPVTPPVIIQESQAPVNPVIYYCRATGTNYPETMSCPGGWLPMTAQTPPQL